jgi:hypothetical protein
MSDIHISMESHPLREVWEAIIDLRKNQVSLQEEVNSIATELDKVGTDLAGAQETLQAEINNLANQNPGVDLSGLRAAAQPLDAAVQALAKLEPTPAAPPVETPPVTPTEPVAETSAEPVAESPPTV